MAAAGEAGLVNENKEIEVNLQRFAVAGLAALALAAPSAHAQSSPLHRWSQWTTVSHNSKVLHICD